MRAGVEKVCTERHHARAWLNTADDGGFAGKPANMYGTQSDNRLAIDDPNAGWKGRGLWSTNGDRVPWLMETGKGSKPRAVHIQLRPDPLAH